jgi:hypothetical protein
MLTDGENRTVAGPGDGNLFCVKKVWRFAAESHNFSKHRDLMSGLNLHKHGPGTCAVACQRGV